MIIEEKYKEFFKYFTEKTYENIRHEINNNTNIKIEIKIIEITDYETLKEKCDVYNKDYDINYYDINNDLFKFKDSYYYFNEAVSSFDFKPDRFYFLKMDEKLANMLLMDISL